MIDATDQPNILCGLRRACCGFGAQRKKAPTMPIFGGLLTDLDHDSAAHASLNDAIARLDHIVQTDL